MITREQVADLHPGDVVELRDARMPDALLRGRVEEVEPDVLGFGIPTLTILRRGELIGNEHHTLTVVSRAPRLYVNHSRTEPVPGDVVRDADRPDSVVSWSRAVGSLGNHGWCYTGSATVWCASMPARLRLLVDGKTGQAVQ